MQKVNLFKMLSVIAIGLFSFTGTALADGEWATSGANIFNTNTTNVGIGTTTPTAKLQVVGGGIKVAGASEFYDTVALLGAAPYLYIGSSSGAGQYGYLWWDDTNKLIKLAQQSSGGAGLAVNSVGNVGIGTPTPTVPLEVQSNSNTASLRVVGRSSDNISTILFSDNAKANSILLQSNGINSWFYNGNVGIGKMNPEAKLVLQGVSSTNAIWWNIADGTGGYGATNGAIAGKLKTVADSGAYGSARLTFVTIGTSGEDIDTMSLKNGNVGIGTTNPQSTLAVNGTITTKKIKVTETGWSDFVFADDYKLPSLAAVEDHIKKHKHLPGIPSASEIGKKGLDVSDVLAKQMQKIEELTLYMIEMKKENQDLKKRLNTLEKQVVQN